MGGGKRFIVSDFFVWILSKGKASNGNDEALPSNRVFDSEIKMDGIGRTHPARQAVKASGDLSPIVFLTVCTAQRKRILASAEIHALLAGVWEQADHWAVGRYVILPDHVHMFCSPAVPEAVSIQRWVQYWKALASRAWPRREEQPIWQLDGWDTQLRKSEGYDAKWEYVRNNPVRHGLVTKAEDWPYQGELRVLMWHDR